MTKNIQKIKRISNGVKFDSPYNPKLTEEKIYRLWEKSGFFNPDKLPGKRTRKFSVMMAPPNITGSLHMGHVLENTATDILIRRKRMKGYRTLWLPGIDHAGISAQVAVEKELRKQGVRRQDLGREKFIGKVKEWKEKYGTVILDQLKKLGVSPDWSRTRYTLDEDYSKSVFEAFRRYQSKGWIYRGERVINWCPRCETGISDLEVEYREEKGKLYYIKYPLENHKHIAVATTRPETMLGDSAVAVNPKDKRYKSLIGKSVILPIQNRKIPIISDTGVDMKFGTGAVKITPAHDATDFEVSLRHNLPRIKVIDEKGIMTKEAGPICEGLNAGECRDKVAEKLKELGLLEKIEDYVHNVAYCERCSAKIEPRLSSQWFLKMKELAKLAIKVIKNEETAIVPKKWERVLLNRLKNERDWNISRQLWWGHRLPVWFHEPKCLPKKGHESETVKCQEFAISLAEPKCEFCDAKFVQSPDVLDTWFSSALWPFATLGWPIACVKNKKSKIKNKNFCKPLRGSDLAEYYPTDFITSARDILNIWIAKMIFSGKEFTGRSPFKVAYIHAIILNKEGRRMSKSFGTGVDPLGLIDRYGADAARFGIIYQNLGNQDIRFNEEAMTTGKKFCNKIWNASRYVFKYIGESSVALAKEDKLRPKTEADKKILSDLKKTIKEVEKLIEKYEFGHALHELYDFFWHDFCDTYLEKSKEQLNNAELAGNTRTILSRVLMNSLKLLHPFMPFITEEIWGEFNKKNLLLIEKWPA